MPAPTKWSERADRYAETVIFTNIGAITCLTCLRCGAALINDPLDDIDPQALHDTHHDMEDRWHQRQARRSTKL